LNVSFSEVVRILPVTSKEMDSVTQPQMRILERRLYLTGYNN